MQKENKPTERQKKCIHQQLNLLQGNVPIASLANPYLLYDLMIGKPNGAQQIHNQVCQTNIMFNQYLFHSIKLQ